MLGSHNSCSFAKQIGWTKFIPTVFSKCQNMNLKGQYACGVRYFDIRVTYYKGQYITAHGMVRYNMTLLEALETINSFEEKCYVGIIIEDTFLKFKGDVNHIIAFSSEYPIVSIYSKKSGDVLFATPFNRAINWAHATADIGDILMPKYDSRDINRILNKQGVIESRTVFIMDFIETLI